MSDKNPSPMREHDARQSAYRGGATDTAAERAPHGSESTSTASDQNAPAADPGADRSGQTQPNFGQAGTYGATGEHAGGAHGKAATGGYHEDAGGKDVSRDERADDDRDQG